MQDQRLLQVFQNVKAILCQYIYYIHIPDKILCISNREEQIPHLMGLQYIGRPNHYTGDFGAYAIKKGKITKSSIEKMIRKYYRNYEKQCQILEMINLKIDNLCLISDMLSSYSKLYLYDTNSNADSAYNSDYLLVHRSDKKIIHLGLIKVSGKEKDFFRCNSFLTTYLKDQKSDIFYGNLEHSFEIQKILREEKSSGLKEVIYQSDQSKLREISGIEKMLKTESIQLDPKLIKSIAFLNGKFGKFLTMKELLNDAQLLHQCRDQKVQAAVKEFYFLLESVKDKSS